MNRTLLTVALLLLPTIPAPALDLPMDEAEAFEPAAGRAASPTPPIGAARAALRPGGDDAPADALVFSASPAALADSLPATAPTDDVPAAPAWGIPLEWAADVPPPFAPRRAPAPAPAPPMAPTALPVIPFVGNGIFQYVLRVTTPNTVTDTTAFFLQPVPVYLDESKTPPLDPPDGFATLNVGDVGLLNGTWSRFSGFAGADATVEFLIPDPSLNGPPTFTTRSSFGLAFLGAPPDSADLLFEHAHGEDRRASVLGSFAAGEATTVGLLSAVLEGPDAQTNEETGVACRADLAAVPAGARLAHERIPERQGAVLDLDVTTPVPSASATCLDVGRDATTSDLVAATLDATMAGLATNVHLLLDAELDGSDLFGSVASALPTSALDVVWTRAVGGLVVGKEHLALGGPLAAVQLQADRPVSLRISSATALSTVSFASLPADFDPATTPGPGSHVALDGALGYLGVRAATVLSLEASRSGVDTRVRLIGVEAQDFLVHSREATDELSVTIGAAPHRWGWDGDARAFLEYFGNGTTASLDVAAIVGDDQTIVSTGAFAGLARFRHDLAASPLMAEVGTRFETFTVDLASPTGVPGAPWTHVVVSGDDAPSLAAEFADHARTGHVATLDPGGHAGRLALLATSGAAPAPPAEPHILVAEDGSPPALRIDAPNVTRLAWTFTGTGRMEVDLAGGPFDVFRADNAIAAPVTLRIEDAPRGAHVTRLPDASLLLRATQPVGRLELLGDPDESISVEGPTGTLDVLSRAKGRIDVLSAAVLAEVGLTRTFPDNGGTRTVSLKLTDGEGALLNWQPATLDEISFLAPGSAPVGRVRLESRVVSGPGLALDERGLVLSPGAKPGFVLDLQDARSLRARWTDGALVAEGAAEASRTLVVRRHAEDVRLFRLGSEDPQMRNFTLGSDFETTAHFFTSRETPFDGLALRYTEVLCRCIEHFRAETDNGPAQADFLLDVALGAAHIRLPGPATMARVEVSDENGLADTSFRHARLRLDGPRSGFTAAWRTSSVMAFVGSATGAPADVVRFDATSGAAPPTPRANPRLGANRDWLILGGAPDSGIPSGSITLLGHELRSASGYAGPADVDGFPTVDFWNWTADPACRRIVREDKTGGGAFEQRVGCHVELWTAYLPYQGALVEMRSIPPALSVASGPKILEVSTNGTLPRIELRWCYGSQNPDGEKCVDDQYLWHRLIFAMLRDVNPGLTRVRYAPDGFDAIAPHRDALGWPAPTRFRAEWEGGTVPIFGTVFVAGYLDVERIDAAPILSVANLHDGGLTTDRRFDPDGFFYPFTHRGSVKIDYAAWSNLVPPAPPTAHRVGYQVDRDQGDHYVEIFGDFHEVKLCRDCDGDLDFSAEHYVDADPSLSYFVVDEDMTLSVATEHASGWFHAGFSRTILATLFMEESNEGDINDYEMPAGLRLDLRLDGDFPEPVVYSAAFTADGFLTGSFDFDDAVDEPQEAMAYVVQEAERIYASGDLVTTGASPAFTFGVVSHPDGATVDLTGALLGLPADDVSFTAGGYLAGRFEWLTCSGCLRMKSSPDELTAQQGWWYRMRTWGFYDGVASAFHGATLDMLVADWVVCDVGDPEYSSGWPGYYYASLHTLSFYSAGSASVWRDGQFNDHSGVFLDAVYPFPGWPDPLFPALPLFHGAGTHCVPDMAA